MYRISFVLVCLLCWSVSMFAQGAKFGIKAGINISTISGPMEENELGEVLENTKFLPGFHLGPTLSYEFTDKVGFQVELLYSQKGGKYSFNDDSSYFLLIEEIRTPVDTFLSKSTLSTGRKKLTLTNNNGYLEIPLMLHYKPIPKLRIGAGLSFGVLLNSTGVGSMDFTGRIWQGTVFTNLDRFTVNVQNKYNKDDGLAEEFQNADLTMQEVLSNENPLADRLYAPSQIGAYYDFNEQEKNGRYFNTLDLGANLELAYVFDTGLHFGIRANYGLLDATNNRYDFNGHQLDSNLEKIARSDKDKNISIQISIGFGF